MAEFDYEMREDLITVTRLDVLGELPDPFMMKEGTRVDTEQKWREHRKELYKTAVELQYGTLPPQPEFLEVETTYISPKFCSYRIKTGRREKPVTFYMKAFLPQNRQGTCPVVIDGDMCFGYCYNKEYLSEFVDKGIIFVTFDRTELAHDISSEPRGTGQLYDCYPEYGFGALGAWAWGYSRCVDAVEKLGWGDMDLITFTGHSRGGKTAALAGAVDERAAIVNPNATCAGACGCYRIHMSAIKEDGKEAVSETLADILRVFPIWFGEGMNEYAHREQELPFDCHYLKALVAPRVLFVSEAASDIWSNPVGSWMTTMAAGEVYKFLGAEENLFWYFRKGVHYHDIEDVRMLVNIILHKKWGEPLSDRFFKKPFTTPELIYNWSAPQRKDV